MLYQELQFNFDFKDGKAIQEDELLSAPKKWHGLSHLFSSLVRARWCSRAVSRACRTTLSLKYSNCRAARPKRRSFSKRPSCYP
jgi:hypothetical protein